MSTVRCAASLMCILTLLLSLAMPSAHAQTERRDLYIGDDPRPVAAAVLSLTDRYPNVITYEDPRYEFAGDIRDVTDQVRDPLNPNNAGKGRLLVPRGGALFASYDVSAETDMLVDARSAVDSVLESNNANPTDGRFRAEQTGQALHVVPTEARDDSGRWVEEAPVLDTPITISSGELNGFELIQAILDRVSEASGADILGVSADRFAPTFLRYTGRIEAENEPARDVLLRALHSISERFTWHFNYDPSGKYYVLAVHVTAEPSVEVPLDPSVLPRPGDPTPTGGRLPADD